MTGYPAAWKIFRDYVVFSAAIEKSNQVSGRAGPVRGTAAASAGGRSHDHAREAVSPGAAVPVVHAVSATVQEDSRSYICKRIVAAGPRAALATV